MATLDEVLGLVNAARVALGAQPASSLPEGRVRENDGCVIARMLDAHVEWDMVWFDSEDRARRVAEAWATGTRVQWPSAVQGPRYAVGLPVILIEFCRDFDNWRYPALVEVESASPSG